jgi:hypothetical protein
LHSLATRWRDVVRVSRAGTPARIEYNGTVRALADASKVQRFMEELGRRVRGEGTVYLTGGATAVLLGWRASTVDIDVKLDPEPPGAFDAIARLKDDLDLNVELAAPDDFIPPLPEWRAHSQFIAAHGPVRFFHYDFRAQALAKIERGHTQDVLDVRELLGRGLVEPAELRRRFEEIVPAIARYPALDADDFRAKVDAALGRT